MANTSDRFYSIATGKISPNIRKPAEQAVVTRLVTLITFMLIFIMAARTPLDSDMWWHLRAGEDMLRTGRFLNTDIFSFTRAGANWINTYWLFDTSFALLFRGGGFFALSAATALLALLSMGLVFKQCEGPVFLKSAALLLGSVVASMVWSPRPQLASLVLTALVGYLLYLYKWRGQNALWALPLTFVLWSNMHGGYPLGLILIGAMIAGEMLNHILAIPTPVMLSWKKIAVLAGWAVVCGLAVLVNPNGLDMWRLPFQTVNMQVLQQFIPEWESPDFHSLLEQMLLWLLFAIVVAVAFLGRMMDGSDLITVLAFAYLALLARRNFGPFALVAVPVLIRYARAALLSWFERAQWLNRFRRGSIREDSPSVRAVKKSVNLVLVGLIVLIAYSKLYVVSHPVLVDHYIVDGYPTRAIKWLEENRAGERILNEYNWGGFMQWSLPGFKIFVDGRTDLFGDEVIGEWMKAVQADAGWENILSKYEVDLVMLQPDRPLFDELPSAGWKLLYQDSQAVIYGRR